MGWEELVAVVVLVGAWEVVVIAISLQIGEYGLCCLARIFLLCFMIRLIKLCKIHYYNRHEQFNLAIE